MARNKIQITPDNSAEWLASCGFLFPTNETELARFDKLFGSIDPEITGDEVDPFKIVKGSSTVIVKKSVLKKMDIPTSHYQMVARKLNDLPQHIADKIKKNQENKTGNADSAEKKSD